MEEENIIYRVRWQREFWEYLFNAHKSFKVPAVVHKYVARQAMEEEKKEEEEENDRVVVPISNNQKLRRLGALCGELMKWGRSGGEQEEKEMDVTPW